MNPKRDDKSFYIKFAIIVYAIAFIVACHAGKAQALGEADNMFEALGVGLSKTFSPKIFSCFPIESYAISYIFSFTIIFALFFAYMIFDKQRNEHYKKGEESGTAHWNTDFKKYNAQFVEPIVKLKDGKPVEENTAKKKKTKSKDKVEQKKDVKGDETDIDEVAFDEVSVSKANNEAKKV